MFETLLFAAVAIFLFIKLRNAFGVRDENDEKRKQTADDFLKKYKDNIIDITNTKKDINDNKNNQNDYNFGFALDKNIKDKLNKINFDEKTFLQGAENAMEMINEAFSNKDLDTLKNILDKDSYKNFKKKIDALGDRTAKSSLIAVKEKKIDNITSEGDNLYIDVYFKTQQINYIEDKDGNVIFGSKKDKNDVIEIWVFTKDVKSKENFWQLSSIEERQNS